MRIPKRPFQLLSLLVLPLLLSFCASPSGGPNSSCEKNDDCNEGLECRAKRCRTPLDNKAPSASIFVRPSTPSTGNPVKLDGSESRDPDGDNLAYAWTLEKQPEGSDVKLANTDQAQTEFVPEVAGEYVVQLIVTDSRGTASKASTPESVTITVTEQPNTKPSADAGEDQTVGPGSSVALDGSKSTDPENQELTYAWTIKTKPDGSAAALANADQVKPTFTADKEGKYILELVVTDSRKAKSDPDTVTIVAMVGFDKVPSVSKISPDKGVLGEEIKVTVDGKDFVAGATVRIGSQTFKTNFKSESQLEVTVNLQGLTAKTHDFFVVNPNNKFSQPPAQFTVEGIPAPVLTSLSPNSAFSGVDITVTATGDNFFQDKTEVFIPGQPDALKATVKSRTELEFTLKLSDDVQFPVGSYTIYIRNNPGNLLSKEQSFLINTKPPKPTLRVLNPPSGEEKTKLVFSVHGIGFDRGAEIIFDGKAIKTKYIRRDELQADPELDLSSYKPGEYQVWVRNPGGQDSEKETFRVRSTDPTPVLDRILPFTLYLDEEMHPVAIYGQEFAKGAKIKIGNNEITDQPGTFGQVVWKSDNYLEARINLKDASKWTAGNVDAQVINPNGKTSNKFQLSVTYRVPSLNGLSPSSWSTKCDTDIHVYGLNFIQNSKVQFNSTSSSGTKLTYSTTSTTNKLTYVSDRELTFRLAATKLTSGKYEVFVDNGTNAQSSKVDFAVDSNASPTPSIRYINPSVGESDTKIPVRVYPNSSSGQYQSIKPGAVVTFNGKVQPTTCNSNSSGTYCYSLEATIDLNGVKPGDYEIFIVNPCNVKSAPLSFNVEAAPEPHISGFQPAFVKVGDKTKIVIKGGNFTQNHQLLWGGKVIKSTYKSATEIETDAIDFASATLGEIDVQIKTASGASSGIAKFSVVNPFAPTISEVVNNVQERGGTLSPMQVLGTGFVLTSEIFVDGKAASTRYVSPTELLLRDIDTKNMKVGIYSITVRNGSRSSNSYPLVLLSPPKPRINYISPSSVVAGTVTKQRITIYGSRFVTTPLPSIVITGPDQKDLSSRFTITTSFPSSTYLYGEFDISGLGTGRYNLQVKNATGELSNAVGFQLTPPPPPTVSSLSPSFIFRHGSANQAVKIIGSNFVNTDLVIFDENSLAALPVTVKQSNEAEFTIDATKLKASREYTVYLRRYLDKNQTQFQDTQKLKLEVRDPPCAAINNCANLTGEACDSADSVCRPKCTTTADCKSLDAKATWTCQSGFCK